MLLSNGTVNYTYITALSLAASALDARGEAHTIVDSGGSLLRLHAATLEGVWAALRASGESASALPDEFWRGDRCVADVNISALPHIIIEVRGNSTLLPSSAGL